MRTYNNGFILEEFFFFFFRFKIKKKRFEKGEKTEM